MAESNADPIMAIVEEALNKHREEMMRQFSQILQSPQQSDGGGKPFSAHTPFKVQANYDIPKFEGKFDADAMDEWISKLDRYISVNTFSMLKR